jgi:hypothetical protein
MTMTGMMVGTPLYMSPEQFMGKKAGGEIDGRTDIYSLGVVLYQMVTAKLPFEGDTIYSLMMQHMEGSVRPPHELVPELHIPESLSHVILKAIDKSRDQRFQTAEEFIAALDRVASVQVASERLADAAVKSDRGQNQRVTPPVLNVAAASSSRISEAAPKSEPSVATNVTTPAPSAAVPVAAQPPVAGSSPATQPPDSLLVKSAEQHLFLQPRKSRLKHFLILAALVLIAVLIGGAGYLKYQAIRRAQIEAAVVEQLNTSPTLRKAALRVLVSDTRQVTLDGRVPSIEDFAAAGNLAASVPGVTGVTNRVAYPSIVPTAVQNSTPAASSESLISDGTKYMDDGKYAEAIQCFSKAAEADPSNQRAKELLDHAQKAQTTEERLLKNRR